MIKDGELTDRFLSFGSRLDTDPIENFSVHPVHAPDP